MPQHLAQPNAPAAREHEIEYPLRHPHDRRNFYLWLILAPALLTTLLTHFFAELLFKQPGAFSLLVFSAHPFFAAFSLSGTVLISSVHFLALLAFLWLFWLPIQLAAYNLWDWLETALIIARTFFLVAAIRALFPHDLILEFLDENKTRALISRGYEAVFAVILLAYCVGSLVNNSRKAFGDVRRAAAPEKRARADRWPWFDAFSLFFVFFAVIVLELYFLAMMRAGGFTSAPYESFKMKHREAGAFAAGGRFLATGAAWERELTPADSAQFAHKLEAATLALLKRHATMPAGPGVLQDSTAAGREVYSLALSPSFREKLFAQLPQAGSVVEKARRENRMLELAWLCCAMLSALTFFVAACLPNRLMHAALIPVTFHERDMKGVIFKAHRYLHHFVRAMLLKNPLLMLGGLLMTVIFLITPAILTGAGRLHHLDLIAQADEIILALAVFLSWFIPLALAAVAPDDTFGEYFNHRVADHLMMIQNHLVFIGHGDLGKRVLDREINRFEALSKRPAQTLPKKIAHLARQSLLKFRIQIYEFLHAALTWSWKTKKEARVYAPWRQRTLKRMARGLEKLRLAYHENRGPNHRKTFIEIVTPDLRLEKMCGLAVVIERDLKDVVYSSNHPLLGDYGAVAACRKDYASRDARGNFIHPEKRLLVPILRGEAREPFMNSRVNLERASLVISMVPDEESVQAVFERANKANVSSIICVSRSDQIAYLTYRSRHRPIVLVYPKENQGIALGERLWAAVQKVRAVRRMEASGLQPRVLIIGNNKANHYMLERLWTYLPGAHEHRRELLRNHFAFIVTDAQSTQAHPTLREPESEAAFDQSFLATFVTSARFPYPAEHDFTAAAIAAVTSAVNTADIRVLEACLREHRPDILLINHEDVEKSLLMLSRCMRALERIKTSMAQAFHLPLLLLAAARGDDWERRSLGDASRYYDALCRLHREDLATDMSYPVHAYYDHLANEQIGESIIDSLADVEEIIAGARTALQNPLKPPPAEDEIGFPKQPAKPKFIEVNGCLPNRAGALADYLASLAGIVFDAPDAELVQKLRPGDLAEFQAPSFQYLRNITLDPERHGFALSGYAALAPLPQKRSQPLVARAFANDGRRYAERELDPDMADSIAARTNMAAKLAEIPEPVGPGVPEVLQRLTGLTQITVKDFRNVLLDPRPNETTGPHACPGMSICRIAALQDYVVASNSLRLHRLVQTPEDLAIQNDLILHAKNYACCAQAVPPSPEELPRPDSHSARIFCCGHGKNEPGQIAAMLNTLLFRSNFRRVPATEDPKTDWALNIDYFKGITCQNPNFSLIRLFGFFEPKPEAEARMTRIPFHLLRILPIGNMESIRHWYHYGLALHAFLNEVTADRKFKFYWIDENRLENPVTATPSFDKSQGNYPVALVVKALDRKPLPERKEELCELCWEQPREYDCRKLRVWV
jgi:hypothetical protein